MTPEPIETRYAGCRFRSRLEARHAVALDVLGIQWDYEYEAYQTDAGAYLPDFRLPELKIWLEIKPEPVTDPRHAAFSSALTDGWQLLVADGPIPAPAELADPERDATDIEIALLGHGHTSSDLALAYQAARSYRFEPGAGSPDDEAADLMSQLADRYDEAIEYEPGIPTGFRDLDAFTLGGLRGGQLVTIGGIPGIGTTTFGLDLLRSCSILNGLTGYLATIEGNVPDVTRRILCAEAAVALHHLRGGNMTDDDWQRATRRTGEVAAAPLFIDDTPAMDLAHIERALTSLKRHAGLRLAVIDPVHLLTPPTVYGGREQQFAEIARLLKQLAKRLDIAVVAIVKIARATRSDTRPMLGDFRSAAAFEQDSDLVVFIHREDAYDANSLRVAEADLIVAKHRGGSVGVATVCHQSHYGRFIDFKEPENEPEIKQTPPWKQKQS